MSGPNGLRGAASGTAAREHLAAGRWIYYRERDTPRGLLVKEYPDGRRELVRLSEDQQQLIPLALDRSPL